MIRHAHWMFGIVISERHAIQRNDLPRFSIQMHVGIAVCGCIHNTPELPLAGCDIDLGAKAAIDREYPFGGFRVSTAVHFSFGFLQSCHPVAILLNCWSAED